MNSSKWLTVGIAFIAVSIGVYLIVDSYSEEDIVEITDVVEVDTLAAIPIQLEDVIDTFANRLDSLVPSDTIVVVDMLEEEEEEEEPLQPTSRFINCYNGAAEPLQYVIADEKGLAARAFLNPNKTARVEIQVGTYLMGAYDEARKCRISFPVKKFMHDTTKYATMRDQDGEWQQRIINPATADTNDYDEAWLMMSGQEDMLLMDVTSILNSKKDDPTSDADWMALLETRYDGLDLIEPLYKVDPGKRSVSVVGPGQTLPKKAASNVTVYCLVPIPHRAILTNELLETLMPQLFN